jgi:hypothetical protein
MRAFLDRVSRAPFPVQAYVTAACVYIALRATELVYAATSGSPVLYVILPLIIMFFAAQTIPQVLDGRGGAGSLKVFWGILAVFAFLSGTLFLFIAAAAVFAAAMFLDR